MLLRSRWLVWSPGPCGIHKETRTREQAAFIGSLLNLAWCRLSCSLLQLACCLAVFKTFGRRSDSGFQRISQAHVILQHQFLVQLTHKKLKAFDLFLGSVHGERLCNAVLYFDRACRNLYKMPPAHPAVQETLIRRHFVSHSAKQFPCQSESPGQQGIGQPVST